MMLKFLFEPFRIKALTSPVGYFEDVLANSRRVGSYLLMSWDAYHAIQSKWTGVNQSVREEDLPIPLKQAKPIGWIDMIRSAATEGAKWAAAGFPICNVQALEARAAECFSCIHWKPRMWGGTGGCELCRCSNIKLYLATTSCFDKPPRWKAIK